MHPSEAILNTIKSGIEYNIEDVKTVRFVDDNLELDDLSAIVITTDGEEIENYNLQYLARLGVQLDFYYISSTFDDEKKIFQMAKGADDIVKGLSEKVEYLNSTDLGRSQELEYKILTMSTFYRITYKRTRGLL